ncbi:MAG: hypothetical protein IJY76_01915 [Anaerotignum sp.]|nr:hypothetical protein [Anaerotignum sp.]
MKTESVWRALPRRIREKITEKDLENIQEVRLRCGQPVMLKEEVRICFLEERV